MFLNMDWKEIIKIKINNNRIMMIQLSYFLWQNIEKVILISLLWKCINYVESYYNYSGRNKWSEEISIKCDV